MFNYRVLPHHLCIMHFQQALSHFFPVGNATDVVQHGTALSKMDSLFYMFDKGYAAKIHVIILIVQSSLIMNAVGFISIYIIAQLTGSEQKCEMLIVIKAPYAMRTSRFKVVICLQPSHEDQIPLKHFVQKHFIVIDSVNSQFAHAIQEYVKIQFMSCAIINSFV